MKKSLGRIFVSKAVPMSEINLVTVGYTGKGGRVHLVDRMYEGNIISACGRILVRTEELRYLRLVDTLQCSSCNNIRGVPM